MRIKRKPKSKKEQRAFKKSERHIITDIHAFSHLATRETLRKYDDIDKALLNLISVSYVITNDNKGYFTKFDMMRYTGLGQNYCETRIYIGIKKGYFERINAITGKYASRFKLTVKANNLLTLYNKQILSLLDYRSPLAPAGAALSSVRFSDLGAHFRAKRNARLKAYSEAKKAQESTE